MRHSRVAGLDALGISSARRPNPIQKPPTKKLQSHRHSLEATLHYSLSSYSKSDNSHRNLCSHTSVIPWVLASGGLDVIGCSVTLRLLRDCRDLSIIRLMRLFSLFLGEGPARGAPGPVRFLCTLLWCLRGTWLLLARARGLLPVPLSKPHARTHNSNNPARSYVIAHTPYSRHPWT